ncbi:MAG TPA: Hsp20/alpha crystallin family protein [Flavobacteriaceae bacterium]|nr:Hsp20/alpha crystallin family protein [Flavobacteriaceae bacterium]
MSNLVPTKKNGALSHSNSGATLLGFPSWIDELFNKNFGSEFVPNFNTGMTLPSVNIKENTDSYLVQMAIPGLKKSDFDINLDNEVLTISVETQSENLKEDEVYTRKEFEYAAFKRSFTLPETADTEKINAKYTDGLLNIVIPKREEAKRKPRKQIKVS